MKYDKSIQQGFSILEVLISLVVLSVGLIGASAVQVSTLKFTQVSQQRSTASQQLLTITEKMRSNLAGVRAGSYAFAFPYAAIPGSIPAAVACPVGCTAAQIAQRDLNTWQNELNRSLPGGRAVITSVTAPTIWQITVMWEEKDLAAELKSACPPAVAAPANVQCISANFLP
jgi:type IV pilus assembly protein PilV